MVIYQWLPWKRPPRVFSRKIPSSRSEMKRKHLRSFKMVIFEVSILKTEWVRALGIACMIFMMSVLYRQGSLAAWWKVAEKWSEHAYQRMMSFPYFLSQHGHVWYQNVCWKDFYDIICINWLYTVFYGKGKLWKWWNVLILVKKCINLHINEYANELISIILKYLKRAWKDLSDDENLTFLS